MKKFFIDRNVKFAMAKTDDLVEHFKKLDVIEQKRVLQKLSVTHIKSGGTGIKIVSPKFPHPFLKCPDSTAGIHGDERSDEAVLEVF